MKRLVFDSAKFISAIQKADRNLPIHQFEAINDWDGFRVHKYSSKNVMNVVFGETHYIKVGSEKISVGEEFCRWINKDQIT